MKDKKIYFWGGALLLLSLLLHSCQAIIPDDIGQEKKSITYLQFNMNGITMPGSDTRAQGDAPSINTDATDYEDYVRELAVLVYNASTGELVKAQFSTTPSFVMEFEAKTDTDTKYHFCFIANFPPSWKKTLQGLRTYEGLKNEFIVARAFWGRNRDELYNGATEENLFPMARIYENQKVTKGGSFANPVPFKPTTSAVGSLLPISNWLSDKESSTTLSSINLIRTSAKISLTLSGDGLDDVNEVYLRNYRESHTYMCESQAFPTNTTFRHFNGSNFQAGIQIGRDGTWSSVMYIPENLLGIKSDVFYWDTSEDKPIGGITYICVRTKSMKEYRIPVIVNGDNMGNEYIKYARGEVSGFTPDYSIVRNHEYHFDIILPSQPTDIDLMINYWVKPWDIKTVPIQFD